MKKDRRPLQEWEKQECASLKAEFLAYNLSPPNGKKLTQEEAAHALGMSQGTFSSHLNGYRALNKEMAATLAKMLGIPVSRFSKRLAKEIQAMSEAAGINDASTELSQVAEGSSSTSADLVLEMLSRAGKLTPEGRQAILSAVDEASDKPAVSNVITADFSRPGPVGDEIRIAHYDVQGAMGNGKLVHDYPEMFRDVTVSQKQLRDLGVTYKDPSHLKIISGDGQSMSPIIQHLDPMISDVSIREYTGDGIYAFTWQGHFYIKSLQIADEDHFLMVSANETLYPPKKIRIDDTYIQARILLVWKATRV
ncbi:LexA family transcriptional regulator [Stutzerimonas nitrititolerans]|uniref:LexA family transcriptional regulator n=1 Tax=Stutzerimonas nitrititolerans TaxID=2482751 RepID=UPI0028AF7C37|nr:XRE family transcriptional regulator [Stutzerimonas nitrititolerans]